MVSPFHKSKSKHCQTYFPICIIIYAFILCATCFDYCEVKMFWGITPALNLFEELSQEKLSKNVINILLIGGCDARHVLKTLSKKYQHSKIHINFYIMDKIPEAYAKQILLLNLAFQPVKNLGLFYKTRLFMEIYGNMLIRPPSARYLAERAFDLIEMITNLELMKKIMPFVKINLKYKERDYIENVFKFWACNDKFDVLDCWDRRLRKMLTVRYDSRIAAFDWDLHMTLHDAGAKQLNSQEYQSFRRNGIAFTWLETEVTRTNRSMVTGIIPNGDHFGHYGYLGDMRTGPFITYGLECSDPEFTKKSNNVYKYRSTDIAERNLREIFHELEFATEYTHQPTSSVSLGSTIMKIQEVKVVETRNVDGRSKKYDNECFVIPGITIEFASMKNLDLWKHREQFREYFDLIYFASLPVVKNIDKEFVANVSADKCVLIVENPLFNLEYRESDLKDHFKQVEEMLEGVKKYKCPFELKKDCYMKYVLE